MRVLLQRVSTASVSVDDMISGSTGPGYLLLVGITHSDTENELKAVADKIVNLRILEDTEGRMNLSALDSLAGEQPVGMLVVSQFTLYGDIRKGRRPSFTRSADPNQAAPMIDGFADYIRGYGFAVEQGVFGARMMVSLVNDGPVTIWIDSDDLRQSRNGVDSRSE
jgi:D-tyrosyl-tRNA(Tyr) deacylase